MSSNLRRDMDRKFIIEFLELYETLPALWNIKCKEYSNRNIKHEQYKLLLTKFREQYPDADKQQLVKKINSLRTNYRRELKRVNEAYQKGEVFEPTLWYFEGMKFLQNHEDEKPCSSQNDSSIQTAEFEPDEVEINETLEIHHQNKKSKTIGKQISERNKLLKEALDQLRNDTKDNSKDDATIFADSWAVSFRSITGVQKIYAKKAIEDILYLGMLGHLTPNCVHSSYLLPSAPILDRKSMSSSDAVAFDNHLIVSDIQEEVKIEKVEDFLSGT